ncbi:MAG: hypothetical protein IPN09_04305 [Bacteroidetes bacterium]|nr:hypothetical protein [Bacteroidota bacterium]
MSITKKHFARQPRAVFFGTVGDEPVASNSEGGAMDLKCQVQQSCIKDCIQFSLTPILIMCLHQYFWQLCFSSWIIDMY